MEYLRAKVKFDDTIDVLEKEVQKDMKKFKVHILNIKQQNESYSWITQNLTED